MKAMGQYPPKPPASARPTPRTDPLETVLTALATDARTKIEIFTDASSFSGIHVEPGKVIEFERAVTFRITGPQA